VKGPEADRSSPASPATGAGELRRYTPSVAGGNRIDPRPSRRGAGTATLLGAALLAASGLATAGCAGFAPRYERPPAPIPGDWPIPPSIATAAAVPAATAATPVAAIGPAADVGWRDFLPDERLEQVIALALENNRDLRTAVLNVERSRALWAIRRADRLPSVGGTVTGARQRLPASQTGTGRGETVSSYGLEVGVTAYEVDLFGRVRNLSQAALERFFASEENRRSAQLLLIADVANAWLALAADRELQRLAEETVASQESSFRLTERRYELGAVSGLEVSQAQTTVESARVDAARFAGDVARDLNLLTFLVGGPIDPALLPPGFDVALTAFPQVAAGVPSEALLRRPDVLAAERFLRAAHADIGAARAAFLPRISLTGSAGVSSSQLSSLFDGGTGAWSFIPQISIPVFQGGRLRAGLRVAEVDRELALNDY
jgi:multidrug efflux system outer membrane protein